jgi:hypothetical protein
MGARPGRTPDAATTTFGANQSDAIGNASSDKPTEQTNQAFPPEWDTLAELAERIRAEHKSFVRQTVARAIAIGELLIEAKKRVGHGDWSSWVGTNCEFSERTAQAYAQIARNRGALEANPKPVADLGIREILKHIGSPSSQPVAITYSKESKAARTVAVNVTHARRPPKVLSKEETQAAIDKANADLDRTPAGPAPTPAKPLARPSEISKTPALLKGQEAIDALRAHLDRLEDHDAKVARPRAGGAR